MNEPDGQDAIGDEQSELALQDLVARTEEEIGNHLDGVFDADSFLEQLRRRVAGRADAPVSGSARGGSSHSNVRRETGEDAAETFGVLIGSVSASAFSIGDNSVVYSHHTQAPDSHYGELLAAVLQLRADLARLTPTEASAALDLELAKTADEIQAAGAAAPGQLARLRQALQAGGAMTEILASVPAVAAALASLLG
ncbi:hypothetical protein ACWGE1_02830 [Streptomyces sp. NPDC054932]